MAVRNLVPSAEIKYTTFNLGIKPGDPIVGDVYHALTKNYSDLAWMGIGLDPNVTAANEQSDSEISPVGFMQPFDFDGNSVLGHAQFRAIG